MLEQAQAELPNECCGLLAGRVEGGVGRVEMRYPLANEAYAPRKFTAQPRGLIGSIHRRRSWRRQTREYNAEVKGLIDADKVMRAKAIDLLAIYHSHPMSEPVPSRTDLARNFYGTCVMYLIIGLAREAPSPCAAWFTRAWWLNETDFVEASWELID